MYSTDRADAPSSYIFNKYGPLGDGTTTDRFTPVQVAGLTGVTAIAGGKVHSLALKSDGTVWAWGDNQVGELGDGTTTDRSTPVRVVGLTGVTAIAGGSFHSLALKNNGTVWAWGGNYYGQLGDGTTTNRSTPVQVAGLTGVTAIVGTYGHSLALKNDGTVWAWGDNSYGELGDGTTTNRFTPVQVTGLTGVAAIGGGGDCNVDHSLALKNDGTVWAWGYNGYGELGDGTTTDRSTPVQVAGLTGVTAIIAGARGYHSLAVKNDGTAWAWGENDYGQLGDGTTTDRRTPVQVAGLSGVTAVAGGFWHSLFLGLPLPVSADFDEDGDVDQSDFGLLQRCFTDGAAIAPACQKADLDHDLRIDQSDMGKFLDCQTGPGVVAANPHCAD